MGDEGNETWNSTRSEIQRCTNQKSMYTITCKNMEDNILVDDEKYAE